MFTNSSRTYKVEKRLCKLFYFFACIDGGDGKFGSDVSRTEHNIKPRAALQWASLREEAPSGLVF